TRDSSRRMRTATARRRRRTARDVSPRARREDSAFKRGISPRSPPTSPPALRRDAAHDGRRGARERKALRRYAWPGNVRELANFIERARLLSKGRTLEIPLAELERRRHRPDHDDRAATLRTVERMHILRILGETKLEPRWPAGSRGRARSEKERQCLVGDYPL